VNPVYVGAMLPTEKLMYKIPIPQWYIEYQKPLSPFIGTLVVLYGVKWLNLVALN
jgi:hypothetical protein